MGINLMALDLLPRMLSRAQAFDVLSSMANIAGYRAVVEAQGLFQRFFQAQTTAAGSQKPAKVLVIGAGVAGLAAIKQAKLQGAEVRAFDVRQTCREQVEAVGGEFLVVPGFEDEDGAGAGGYAKEISEEFIEAEMALFKRQCEEVDVVITTALIPNPPGPTRWPGRPRPSSATTCSSSTSPWATRRTSTWTRRTTPCAGPGCCTRPRGS